VRQQTAGSRHISDLAFIISHLAFEHREKEIVYPFFKMRNDQ